MESTTTQKIEKSLTEKRENLYHWLESTPVAEKEICTCEDDACVEEHLNIIEESLERATKGSLGICKICHGQVNSSLLEMDYTSAVCLDHFSPEERRRLESELELSQIIQRALLPQQIPAIPGLDLAVFSRPSDILGGDYFDFLKFNDKGFGLAIADVVGHGVSASILMSSLQMALRTLVPQNDLPGKVLEQINHFYIHNVNLTTFITAFLAHFDQESKILTYSNAGQTPPLVIRKQGDQVEWLRPTSGALGLVERFDPTCISTKLSKGDVALFYTDGVTETMSSTGEQFGMEKLAALVKAKTDLASQEIVYAVRQAIHEFSSGKPLADDTTIVALKVN